MPGTNFSKYHTYKWIDPPVGAHPNQIVDQEIKQSVDQQLAEKGLIKTDGDKADLYVSYQGAIDREKQWNGFADGFGGGPAGWGFGGGGIATATSSTIQNGTLVVNMFDPASKQLVWTGQATKTLNPSGNQEKNLKKLNGAVKKILKDFPPPPAKS
jgi:hypothetical protein